MESDNRSCAVEPPVKVIARNILKCCQLEAQTNTLTLPINDYEGRTAHYTGLPRSFISCDLKDEIKYESASQPFDVFERMLVMKSLLKLYGNKKTQFPSMNDLYEIVKQPLKDINLAQFRFELHRMGFDYKNTTTRPILVEDMKFTHERFHYLKKINKCRQDKKIYYLDERLVDATLKLPKPDCEKTEDTNDILNENEYYFYHVLSDAGLGNYIFTNKKSKDTFIKWVFNVLLKVLEPGSLIVLDDHPIHGKLISETITRYHPKTDMVNWLKKNNIPYGITMQKAELYELIRRSPKPNPEFSFDRLLRSHGFDVLRLPYGCNNLSPAALFWKEFSAKNKQEIKDFSPIALEEMFPGAISLMHSLAWKKLCNRVLYWEDQFHDIDMKTETILEQICKFDVNNIVTNHLNIS